ncbi:hypothetical protein A2870_03925 [Candidatus Curtissbacteria bacterium RIFCSPHIGHO2_01_FULL_41_11]|uniref:Lycopene cyclase domain-containing protein n=1 Tax=Candidatus Curtissbacteria bacterium RIFCSPHIGHO2_01_FULL_41_11 TaxID=1797711 RepID=A0A1F5G434_9BACT|nr:MAG: hypothetical protein A2870_03925 [Candidatus Curtissbacteria bacterium RIFCSPHIGHO2_01_FULL_41_11]
MVNFLLFKLLGINSQYALIAVLVLAAIFILVRRKDLFMDVIGSGLCFGVLYFFLFLVYLQFFPGVINSWYKLSNISGVLILGVPLEEPLFAFGFGMVAGPLYEVWQGYRLKKI